MSDPAARPPIEPALVGHAEFARAFRRRAVNLRRVEKAVGNLAGRELNLGPYRAGPLAGLSASGRLGTGRIQVVNPDGPVFAVTLPATLDAAVRLGMESALHAELEVDLVLTPRFADPLLLVIDVEPIRPADVRIELAGRGLGAAVSGLVSGMIGGLPAGVTEELRRQVARQVGVLVDGEASWQARTVDVAARIEGERGGPPPDPLSWIAEADWGRRFVTHAVTAERVRQAFAGFAGRPVEVGPLRAGPGKLVAVRATGEIGTGVAREVPDGFEVALPVTLDLVVGLTGAGRGNRFHAEVVVPLHLVPRCGEDVHLVIAIDEVRPDDVHLVVRSGDTLAGLVGRAGRIEQQLAGQIAAAVNRQVAAARDRIIDVGGRVDPRRRTGDRRVNWPDSGE